MNMYESTFNTHWSQILFYSCVLSNPIQFTGLYFILLIEVLIKKYLVYPFHSYQEGKLIYHIMSKLYLYKLLVYICINWLSYTNINVMCDIHICFSYKRVQMQDRKWISSIIIVFFLSYTNKISMHIAIDLHNWPLLEEPSNNIWDYIRWKFFQVIIFGLR